MLITILAAALIAQAPAGQTVVAKDGDTIEYRPGALVRVVRRTDGNVRAIYNAPHRWLALLVGGDRVDMSLLYDDVDGAWPLGDRWEGAGVIEEYSVLGGPPRVGLGIRTQSGLVQLFSKSVPGLPSTDWFRDPRAIAALTFQDANNRSSPARPAFDQAEREAVQFAEAVFATRERRGSFATLADKGTIDTTITVGGSKPMALGGMQPVRVGGNIRVPQKIVDARPDYPPIAQSAGVQGVVILEIVIGTDGGVVDAKVLRSIPLLDQAALDCVRKWKFEPTQLNGVPVPVIMTATVNFSLQDARPDSPPSSTQ